MVLGYSSPVLRSVAKDGFDTFAFDDLTGTIFAGHYQPLHAWILCFYFMGLNLSNAQIGQELGLDADSAHDMATLLRNGILAKEPEIVLSGEVECDEVYIVAGRWRWILRSSRQYDGRILVAAAILAPATSWYLARKAAELPTGPSG